jgi:hypothetical protein
MSQITIQCRLVANESVRQKLWQLMAEANTPLINELLSKLDNTLNLKLGNKRANFLLEL